MTKIEFDLNFPKKMYVEDISGNIKLTPEEWIEFLNFITKVLLRNKVISIR